MGISGLTWLGDLVGLGVIRGWFDMACRGLVGVDGWVLTGLVRLGVGFQVRC